MLLNIYTDRPTGRLAASHETARGIVEAVPTDDGGWAVLAWRDDGGDLDLKREGWEPTFEAAVGRVVEWAA